MTEKMQIQVGEEVHEVDARPINIVVPATNMQLGPPIRFPRCVNITPEDTVYHARRVQKLHPEFEIAWRMFMQNVTPPLPINYSIDAETIRGMYIGAIHLMGLIDMCLKFSDKNVPIALRYPETYLHPGWQVGIADFIIWLQLGGRKVQMPASDNQNTGE